MTALNQALHVFFLHLVPFTPKTARLFVLEMYNFCRFRDELDRNIYYDGMPR